MARRKRSTGRRYTAAEKRKILRTAKKEGLTGAQVKKRFGVSTLTFYRWRGPVQGRRSKRAKGTKLDDSLIRREIRSRIEKILPKIIREEVDTYMITLFGGGRGRRRT